MQVKPALKSINTLLFFVKDAKFKSHEPSIIVHYMPPNFVPVITSHGNSKSLHCQVQLIASKRNSILRNVRNSICYHISDYWMRPVLEKFIEVNSKFQTTSTIQENQNVCKTWWWALHTCSNAEGIFGRW